MQVLLRLGELSKAASELIICCKKTFSTSDLPESSGKDDVKVDDAPELMDLLLFYRDPKPVPKSNDQVLAINEDLIVLDYGSDANALKATTTKYLEWMETMLGNKHNEKHTISWCSIQPYLQCQGLLQNKSLLNDENIVLSDNAPTRCATTRSYLGSPWHQ
ncbi:hypothetical protein JHK82_050111 [Glycine max]|nr:hypothetical protein JHK82_050111 [Glycine max]